MRLPQEIRRAFARHGRRGGAERALRMTPAARQAVARRAASARWIRARFGNPSFAALGLPGGELIDVGLHRLAAGQVSEESLAVSLAAPRLRREGIPVGAPLANPEDRLYRLIARGSNELAHARYLAWLAQLESFADACRYRRIDSPGAA